MADFVPHFHTGINEQINTIDEERLVRRVLNMSFEELQDLHANMVTEDRLRPGYRKTRQCILASKAIIRRSNDLRKNRSGLSFGETAFAIMVGAIVGDEFAKRFL